MCDTLNDKLTNIYLTVAKEITKSPLKDYMRVLRTILKDVRPSDKFDNPYLIIPWVTNDISEHLC